MKAVGVSVEEGTLDFHRISLPNTTVDAEIDRVTFHRNVEWVYIAGGDQINGEYYADDRHVLLSRKRFNSPDFYIVGWRGHGILVDFLSALKSQLDNCLIDDDHGNIFELSDFWTMLLLHGDSEIG